MERRTHYPRASFLKAMELAKAVDALGGKCTREMCAAKLNRQHTSGSFKTLAATAGKHKLVLSKADHVLELSELYKQIKFAYNDTEKKQNEIEAFLAPPIYREVYTRFLNRELPSAILEKLFIREFEVDKGAAAQVAGYFIEGVRYLDLLVDGKLIPFEGKKTSDLEDEDSDIELDTVDIIEKKPSTGQNSIQEHLFQEQNYTKQSQHVNNQPTKSFVVHIYGPGMDTQINISDIDEYETLAPMLLILKKKIERMQREEIL